MLCDLVPNCLPKVSDISRQLIESEAGKKIDIMFGGGRSSFLPQSMAPNVTAQPRFVC